MLEQMRRSSQSLLIYVLFGILIAVFVINFAPQSMGGCEGSRGGSVESDAAKVGNRTLAVQDFNFGYLVVGGGQASPQVAKQLRLKETIMDRLIERELLAQEAERLGFRVSDEEVEDQIAEAKFIGIGRSFDGSFRAVEQLMPVQNKDGKFDYELFKRFSLYQLGMSPRAFIEEQRREMLAARVRNLLKDGINVSQEEVKSDFLRRGNQVNVEYVRFTNSRYTGEVEPTAAEIEAYAKANEAKLKELYTQRKFLYEKAKDRKLRQILVRLDSGASPDADAAAKKKAEGLLARIKKGETFAAVAKAASEDSATKTRGGELGWKREGATTLGPAIETKVWAAKENEVVGPEKGADGYYLVVAEAKREGDIPFEQVRNELAEIQVRDEKVKARAKVEAEAALVKAKGAAAKSLKDLFPAPSDKDKDKTKVSDAANPAPQAEETGLIMRRGAQVEGIGPAPELAKAIFALTTESPFAGPVAMPDGYIIAKLKERKSPDMAEWEKKKLELQRMAAMMKGEEVVAEWSLRRCVEAKDAKRIGVNRELLRYDQGPEGAVAYEPCSPPMRF
jgi:peptidyl-prolyl cis-trans isomerase D